MAQHSCSCRFKRPPELMAAPSLISCTLLRLPVEILARIFAYAEQIDGVCLALTCKRLLQVSAMFTIRVPSVHSSVHYTTEASSKYFLGGLRLRWGRLEDSDTEAVGGSGAWVCKDSEAAVGGCVRGAICLIKDAMGV
ncbi:hypothetical protein V2G26_020024 [Clonostachys chloroleuca]